MRRTCIIHSGWIIISCSANPDSGTPTCRCFGNGSLVGLLLLSWWCMVVRRFHDGGVQASSATARHDAVCAQVTHSRVRGAMTAQTR